MEGKKFSNEPDCRFIKAINIAVKQHDGQKSLDGRPYFTHCLEVAQLVCEFDGGVEEEVISVLHDVLEDTKGYKQAQMEEDFTREIAKKVMFLTEPQNKPWFVQKVHYLHSIAEFDASLLLVCCCDKIHNLQTIGEQYEKTKEAIWEQMKISKRQKMGFYWRVIKAVNKRMSQLPQEKIGGVKLALDRLNRAYFRTGQIVGYDHFSENQIKGSN